MTNRLVLTALISLITALGGCTQSEWVPGDEENIRVVVADISKARNVPERLAEIFTEDAIPNEIWLTKTEKCSFVVEEVDVNGETAKLKIVLEDHTGDVQGNQTWACKKVDGKWKISDAPLP